MILWTIVLGLLSGVLYRLGGLSKWQAKRDMPWLPSFVVNSKTRDIGCVVLTGVWLYNFSVVGVWFGQVLAGLLMVAGLTTYWDESPINWDKPEDNFFLHGIIIGLALVPMGISTGLWGWMIVRAVTLGILMGVISSVSKNDYVEEIGRGAVIIWTLPLLTI